VKLSSRYIKNNTTYVRFKALKEFVSGDEGASKIDEIRISTDSLTGFYIGNKINLNKGEFNIAGIWLQPIWLLITIISAFIGSSLVVRRDRIMILAGFIAFILPFLLNIFADLNFYILSQTLHSRIGIALSAMIHGIVFGITLDVIDQKRLLKID